MQRGVTGAQSWHENCIGWQESPYSLVTVGNKFSTNKHFFLASLMAL